MGSILLDQLREQTRPAHLALEAQPLLKGLLSSQLTKSEYVEILQAMLAFYQSLESELVPATEALLRRHPIADYHYLPRAPLLAKDCRAMGCVSRDLKLPPLKLWLNSSETYLLGALYVIEGSTQGGRVVARHLTDTLGVTEQSGASFFNIYRQDQSWTAFRRWLGRDSAYNRQDDIERIIEGADMTFSALHNHLDQWQLLTHGK